MKQNLRKNPIVWIVLLVGGGFLLGMTMTNRGSHSVTVVDSIVPAVPQVAVVPEVIEVRKTLDDVVIDEQVIVHENEIVVKPNLPTRPQRPLPPNFVITNDGLNFNYIIRSILNNLTAVVLILIGVWLIVRHNRKAEEKAPKILD